MEWSAHIVLDPGCVTTHVNQAYLHLSTGHLEGALESADRARDIDKESAAAYYLRGLCREREGSPKKAEGEYKKACKLAPTNSAYVRALGLLQESLGRWRKAIDYYEQVVEMTEGSADALYDLGLALRDAGKAKDAARVLEQMAVVSPDHTGAWINLGLVYHEDLRDKGNAARCYRKYLALGGTDKRVHGWLRDVEGN